LRTGNLPLARHSFLRVELVKITRKNTISLYLSASVMEKEPRPPMS